MTAEVLDALRHQIEELFTEARRQWPDLDRWLSEKFISTYTRDDLLACPPGSHTLSS